MSAELLVNINSVDRTSGTSNDFVINFSNDRFSLRPKGVSIVSAGITYSWFNILSGVNDTVTFVRDVNIFTVVIPAGNYTATTLASTLQDLMNAADPGQTYAVSFSSITYLFTFGGASAYQFDFSPPNNQIAQRLGFITEGLVPSVQSTIFVSEKVTNMLADNMIHIHSDLVGGIDNGVIRITANSATSDEIMGAIYISGTYGNTLSYVNSIDQYPLMRVTQSKLFAAQKNTPVPIRFYLRFPSGFPLDLNGTEWSMILKFVF